MRTESDALASGRKIFTIDPWTYYDYKNSFGTNLHKGSAAVPTWVGDHARRLQAYKLLESYYRTAAREWLNYEMSLEERTLRREYGDPATIVDQSLASLLGIDQSIIVDEATTENPDPAAEDQFNLLTEWAELEQFELKVLECEENAVKLGDGCYVIGWDEDVKRPRVTVYDPGFYFPVLDDTEASDQYPNRIHIAWEYKDDDDESYVRRITYDLRDRDDGGTQSLPWNDDTTTKTCYLTDGVWPLKGEKATDPDMFTRGRGNLTVDDLDLEIDFIPVIHIPNDGIRAEHYGKSVMAHVMQIFDDLVSNDTDLQAASATTGTPPIVLGGVTAPKDDEGNIASYGPGSVLETADGNATVIDTSKSLDALLKMKDSLLSRLSVNSKTPEALLGRVKPNEVPSGIALTLGFTPHIFLVNRMRKVRKVKYGLLFKFVCRFYWQNGDLTDYFPTNMEFGSYLPADESETATLVQTLLTAHAISIETGVAMLVKAGFPIENAVEEVNRINSQNFDAANKMLEATGDAEAVRKQLSLTGLPPIPIEPAPAPTNEL